ncbi:hypothetical protein BDZ90DRAFT_229178 [Jaminaea rosea]|uniref:Nascent polypeptide-associated complex subunit alpha-like UBA domain-containing protein n=1 Tax=Jaminaea rosea TaxID=1569628 RepID=A0A316UXV1_9BASI|nr:hypothetical protein BDZ90DRAFT_229178 [Jaminaea rosea]PWN30147.1 hypothetical protein BDZ90DRAFT_229178 [Jaminaea rosea]
MSEAINAVCVDMPDEARKKQAKLAGEKAVQGKKVKKEDVEYLVRELMLPRHKAETALQEADGDLVAAVKKVVVA